MPSLKPGGGVEGERGKKKIRERQTDQQGGGGGGGGRVASISAQTSYFSAVGPWVPAHILMTP